MNTGSVKYRRLMARLDEAGITANIVRIAPKHYELHVNYEIAKASRVRHTCNQHLKALANSKYPPL